MSCADEQDCNGGGDRGCAKAPTAGPAAAQRASLQWEDHAGATLGPRPAPCDGLGRRRCPWLVGRWQEQPSPAGLAARDVVLAAGRAHLEQGHDVVVPQLVAEEDFLLGLQAVANEVHAEFIHVLLEVSPHVSAERTVARQVEHESAPVVSELEAADYAQRLQLLTDHSRVLRVRSAEGDVHATYAALLAEVLA